MFAPFPHQTYYPHRTKICPPAPLDDPLLQEKVFRLSERLRTVTADIAKNHSLVHHGLAPPPVLKGFTQQQQAGKYNNISKMLAQREKFTKDLAGGSLPGGSLRQPGGTVAAASGGAEPHPPGERSSAGNYCAPPADAGNSSPHPPGERSSAFPSSAGNAVVRRLSRSSAGNSGNGAADRSNGAVDRSNGAAVDVPSMLRRGGGISPPSEVGGFSPPSGFRRASRVKMIRVSQSLVHPGGQSHTCWGQRSRPR